MTENVPEYVPTPKEIEASRAEIQQGWTEAEKLRRQLGKSGRWTVPEHKIGRERVKR